MLTIRNTTGSIADVIASMRDVPARLVPYATSTALTRTALIAANRDLPNAMRSDFSNPTPYTLNSLFVQPSTTETLSARVMVKDSAGRGVIPEKFLFPEVSGGGRNEKGFERALRLAGILKAGERVMPGRGVELDAFGNVPAALIRSVLAWAKDGAKSRTQKIRGQKQDNRYGYVLFGKPGARVRGIAQRDGRIFMPLFIFTTTQPLYKARLDFEGVVKKCAQVNFRKEFTRAFDEMRAKGKL
jgi:hypothetical protein